MSTVLWVAMPCGWGTAWRFGEHISSLFRLKCKQNFIFGLSLEKLVLSCTILLVYLLLKQVSCLPYFPTQKMEPMCSLRNVGLSPNYMKLQPLRPAFYSRRHVNLKVKEETILFARSKLYLFLGKLVWFLRSPFCPRPLVGRFVRCWILDPKKTLYMPRTLFIDGELSIICNSNEC